MFRIGEFSKIAQVPDWMNSCNHRHGRLPLNPGLKAQGLLKQPLTPSMAPCACASLRSSVLPSGELADVHVNLETLWGRSAVELRERLCGAAASLERFRMLEEALLAHMFRPLEHHYAVPTALDALCPF